jgi:hypothetical protein
MPAWPTLWPTLLSGKTNIKIDARAKDMVFVDEMDHDPTTDASPLTGRQKQLLYECEEERMVFKACTRELIKLNRTAKMTSWDTAEAANMGID